MIYGMGRIASSSGRPLGPELKIGGSFRRKRRRVDTPLFFLYLLSHEDDSENTEESCKRGGILQPWDVSDEMLRNAALLNRGDLGQVLPANTLIKVTEKGS
jgi:hypothetical protein